VDSSTAEHAPSGAADVSGIEVGDDREDVSNEELPTRPTRDRQLVRKIRRLEDPEILQRVLAGLLNLR
jgi:hypothetical protein